MSPRERADSRPTLYMTGNHAIANRRQISLREAILPVLVACAPQVRYQKLAIAVRVLQNTYNLVISRCCFAENGKEMYKVSKRTCTAIVLLIKPFVW